MAAIFCHDFNPGKSFLESFTEMRPLAHDSPPTIQPGNLFCGHSRRLSQWAAPLLQSKASIRPGDQTQISQRLKKYVAIKLFDGFLSVSVPIFGVTENEYYIFCLLPSVQTPVATGSCGYCANHYNSVREVTSGLLLDDTHTPIISITGV